MDFKAILALLAGALALSVIGLAAHRGKHGDRALLDHLIVGGDSYFSFADEGMI